MHPSAVFADDLEPFAGKYLPVRVIGRGGMGLVFEAKHARVKDLRLAIKVLPENLRGYTELVTRFEREAAALSSLTSVHAVKVFDYDVAPDGRPFIVMELLQGKDLGRVLEDEGSSSVETAVDWLLQACDAIAEAHALGIVHRDIKPSNLFLAEVGGKEVIKVLDFGIAKRRGGLPAITHAVSPLGTPHYMSPEQIRSASTVDPRSDIWSLGITLYELVTGRTPYGEGLDSLATVASITSEPVMDPRTFVPGLPAAFVEVISIALRKDPNERYATVRDFVLALQPFAPASNHHLTPVRERTASLGAVVLASTQIATGTATLAVEEAAVGDALPLIERRMEARRGWHAGATQRHTGAWILAATGALAVGLVAFSSMHGNKATSSHVTVASAADAPPLAPSSIVASEPPSPTPVIEAPPATTVIALTKIVLPASAEAQPDNVSLPRPARRDAKGRPSQHGGLSGPGL